MNEPTLEDKSKIRKVLMPLLKGLINEIQDGYKDLKTTLSEKIEAINIPEPKEFPESFKVTGLPDVQKVTGRVEVDFPDIQRVEVTNQPKPPVVKTQNVKFPKTQDVKGTVRTPDVEKKLEELIDVIKSQEFPEPLKAPKDGILPVRVTNQQIVSSDSGGSFPFADPNGKPVRGQINSRRQLKVVLDGMVSAENSTSTPLLAGGIFTGQAVDILDFGFIFVTVFSNVASATGGLIVQQSSDGVNWDNTDNYTIPANTGKTYSFQPATQYFRVMYTNGASDQTDFRLQTVLKKTSSLASSHRIGDTITEEDDASLVTNVNKAQKPDGTFTNIGATESNNLRVSDVENGLAIAKGDVIGTTFIHKFGLAPDFDTADAEVTIWDGANDVLFGGSPPMVYTYSSTADIGTISSSSNSDTVDIEVQGLDSSYNLVTQTVTLTGQTDASLGTNLLRVFRMINRGASSLVGVVYLRTNGSGQSSGVPSTANTVRAIIDDGNNQTLMALYTVPAGKTAYMRDWYAATAGGSKASSYVIRLKARPLGQVFQLKHISSLQDSGSTNIQYKYEEPQVFAAKTDIEMSATSIATPAVEEIALAAGFDIVLVDD